MLLLHVPAATAAPSGALPYLIAIYLSSEERKITLAVFWAGASHARAAFLAPGSTMTRPKVNIRLSVMRRNNTPAGFRAGAFHASAAVLAPGSTTTHPKVIVPETLG